MVYDPLDGRGDSVERYKHPVYLCNNINNDMHYGEQCE